MVLANPVVMLSGKETTLIAPTSLLHTLVDTPMPKKSQLAQAVGRVRLFDFRLVQHFEHGCIFY